MNTNTIECRDCFHHCRLAEGKTGLCKTRKNEEGQIIDLSYGRITSAALDPIEKKPLARFYPGSLILSVGSYGCSLKCPFCQNWEISQQDLFDQSESVTPQQLAAKAVELQPYGNIGICFTYNEPMLQKNMIRDTFQLAKQKGLKTVIVTSGSSSLEALEEVLPYTDAFNIDLKGFTEDFYKWVGGDLETTKAFIKRAAQDSHVELTMLVIPGKNNDPRTMEEAAKWIASINPEIPLHLSRYFPRYKSQIEMTPLQTLYDLEQTAKRYLRHVYLGNV